MLVHLIWVFEFLWKRALFSPLWNGRRVSLAADSSIHLPRSMDEECLGSRVDGAGAKIKLYSVCGWTEGCSLARAWNRLPRCRSWVSLISLYFGLLLNFDKFWGSEQDSWTHLFCLREQYSLASISLAIRTLEILIFFFYKKLIRRVSWTTNYVCMLWGSFSIFYATLIRATRRSIFYIFFQLYTIPSQFWFFLSAISKFLCSYFQDILK